MNILHIATIVFARSPVSSGGIPTPFADPDALRNILGIVRGIIGALALLIIVISGFRYITSAGDPQKASSAKNGIIYALIGLVIAIIVESIVGFVVANV